MKTKTKIKHTSGPWKFEDTSDADFVLTGPNTQYPLAYLNCSSADAHLMAAAPDLLAAAKKAEQFYKDELEAIGACDHSVNICCCSIIRELEDLQAVIAKAEGR